MFFIENKAQEKGAKEQPYGLRAGANTKDGVHVGHHAGEVSLYGDEELEVFLHRLLQRTLQLSHYIATTKQVRTSHIQRIL